MRDACTRAVEPEALPKPLVLCVMHKVETVKLHDIEINVRVHFMSHMAMRSMRDNLDAE